jgi:hypothetical protein
LEDSQLNVYACEFEVRPPAAPTIDAMMPAVGSRAARARRFDSYLAHQTLISSRFPPCKPSAVNNCTGSRLPDFHARHSGTGSLGFHAASSLIIQPFADMTLTPCTRLGPSVLSAIGGSGMREVYRARATKLIVTSG